MLLYNDIISGDEMFSDAYPIKLVDDIAYEVDCQMITISEGEVDIGANPSAEGGDEGVESTSQTVNNVVHSFRLTETSFDKKSYMSYIKGYMKALKAKLQESNPERIPVFEAKAAALVKKILGNFKDYEFFVGESMDPEGMVGLLNYREDGVTPYFTFFKDGLKEQKLVSFSFFWSGRLCRN
ncbi:translationally controlled tumor protein [Fennellomyces sp. T-0311]|nr:translationally controlled tumor protein [Fennellomyces sp. T-0311]